MRGSKYQSRYNDEHKNTYHKWYGEGLEAHNRKEIKVLLMEEESQGWSTKKKLICNNHLLISNLLISKDAHQSKYSAVIFRYRWVE